MKRNERRGERGGVGINRSGKWEEGVERGRGRWEWEVGGGERGVVSSYVIEQLGSESLPLTSPPQFSSSSSSTFVGGGGEAFGMEVVVMMW